MCEGPDVSRVSVNTDKNMCLEVDGFKPFSWCVESENIQMNKRLSSENVQRTQTTPEALMSSWLTCKTTKSSSRSVNAFNPMRFGVCMKLNTVWKNNEETDLLSHVSHGNQAPGSPWSLSLIITGHGLHPLNTDLHSFTLSIIWYHMIGKPELIVHVESLTCLNQIPSAQWNSEKHSIAQRDRFSFSTHSNMGH